MINFIVKFVQYLNENNYHISVDKISRFFEMLQDEEISILSKEDIISLMKIVFCSSYMEISNLPILFDNFCKQIETTYEIDNLKEKREQFQKKLLVSKQTSKEQLEKIEKMIQTITEEILTEKIEEKSSLTKNDFKFIEENKEKIKKIKFSNKKCNQLIQDCLIDKDMNKLISYSDGFIQNTINELIKMSEASLKRNKLEEFSLMNSLYGLLRKLEKESTKKQKAIHQKLENSTKDLIKKKNEIENEVKKSEEKHQQIQKEIGDKLSQLNSISNVIQKEASFHHREEFINKGNFIQIKDDTVNECINKTFKSLTEDEMNTIYSYLKKNLLHFKTKVSRNIYGNQKQNLDIQRTIQYACKTGGLPLNLMYEEKKKNKTNLVLVLDISGSCSTASKMMLSFMYLLKDVFSGGCSTYVFVDSIYNVSEIMQTNNIDTSINTVLKTIPTKGVYSNYYKPLQSLWLEERKNITSNSILIFMGDARNNKNEKGLEYIKNISRRVKSFYWLNTEKYEKWGNADSLAFDYMKYARMFETLTVGDLIYFINEMR